MDCAGDALMMCAKEGANGRCVRRRENNYNSWHPLCSWSGVIVCSMPNAGCIQYPDWMYTVSRLDAYSI